MVPGLGFGLCVEDATVRLDRSGTLPAMEFTIPTVLTVTRGTLGTTATGYFGLHVDHLDGYLTVDGVTTGLNGDVADTETDLGIGHRIAARTMTRGGGGT